MIAHQTPDDGPRLGVAGHARGGVRDVGLRAHVLNPEARVAARVAQLQLVRKQVQVLRPREALKIKNKKYFSLFASGKPAL